MPTHHHATGNLVADAATIGISAKPHQFLERAFSLHAGLTALAPLEAREAPAAVFLASWCLELTLKAYLATKDQGKKELQPIQHDLAALWTEAAKRGLTIPNTPPRWCVLLSDTHKPPFHQRYPTDKAGSVAPNIQTVVTELSTLIECVHLYIQSTRPSQ